jgi:hypothetical protein
MMRDSGWRLIQLHRNRSLRVAFLHHRFNSLPQFPFNSSGRRHWSPPSSILEDKAPLRSKKTILVIIPFKLTRTPNTQFACVTEGWLGLVRDDESGRLITKASAEDGLDLSGIEVVPGERSTLSGFQSMPMAICPTDGFAGWDLHDTGLLPTPAPPFVAPVSEPALSVHSTKSPAWSTPSAQAKPPLSSCPRKSQRAPAALRVEGPASGSLSRDPLHISYWYSVWLIHCERCTVETTEVFPFPTLLITVEGNHGGENAPPANRWSNSTLRVVDLMF